MAACKDFPLTQGKTFGQVIRWESDQPEVYKLVTAITKSGPVRITAPGHTLVDGWRVAVQGVKGMVEINAPHNPPRCNEYHEISYVDSGSIEINNINTAAVDENGGDLYGDYISGGYLRFFTPVDLTGYTARMDIKDKVGGTVLHSLTTEDGGIVLDNSAKTITLLISATDTAAFTWTRGVYDLEMVSSGGVVSALLSGSITVKKEVTT